MRPYTQYNSIGYGATEEEFLADDTIWGKNIFLYPSDKPTQWKKGDGINTFANLPYIGVGGGSDFPIGTNRQVAGYIDGNRSAITLGWSQLSDLNTPPTFNTGVLTGAMFDPDGSAMFYFKELNDAVGAEAKELTIPVYGDDGVLKVSDGVALTDAVSMRQLGLISTVLMNKTSGGTDVIPASFKGKLIVTFSGASDNFYLHITSDALTEKAGLEITVLNESPDASVVIVSKSGFTQIKLDAGSSPVAEATIAPSSGQYFICNGVHLIGL